MATSGPATVSRAEIRLWRGVLLGAFLLLWEVATRRGWVDPFFVSQPTVLAAQIFDWIRIFTWIVGAGTIVAGIVGVSNIMLISVAERTREFGVRKAVGATPTAIIGMVLLEALVLTGVSGYVGLVAGIGLLEGIAVLLPDNEYFAHPEVSLRVALGATGVLMFAGLLAGFFPARRAAAINPVEALREA